MEILETGLSFGMALDTIKGSVRELGMRLPSWANDKVIRIAQVSNSTPYLYAQYETNRKAWTVSDEELFSEQWQVLFIN